MKSITEEMTLEDMEIVFTLWQKHYSFSTIAQKLHIPQGKIIRCIREMQERQHEKCQNCHWRKDGAKSCVLPQMFCDLKIRQRRK